MAFIPVPNVASVEMIFEQAGQRLENVYHVKKSSPFDEVGLSGAAQLFADWWDEELKPQVAGNVSLVLIVAKALDSETAPAVEFTTGLPLTGPGTNIPNPGNVTVAIRWTTGLRGRSFRGRTYHIGLTQGAIVANSLATENQALLLGAYQTLLSSLSLSTMSLVVVSKYANHVARTTGIATDITAASLDGSLDSQRRRLNGRGR